ncbi:MFS transporter, partial [Alphaproteobacteria bacterium]|nr:MFS transporter [Alphaproteobacteria bacterium]
SLAIMAVILHPVLPYFWAWCMLRIFNGIAIAGSFTAIESWLNAKLNNKNRVRYFSFYRTIDMVGGLIAQTMIIVLVPAHFISYTVIAVLICLSLLPLGLTQSVQPQMPEQERFRPLFAFQISPLAVIGVIVVGATSSVVRMIGPLFAYKSELSTTQTGVFLALFVVGGATAQMPFGFLTERYSSRQMLATLSLLAVISSLAFRFFGDVTILGISSLFILVFIFGASTMPLYSLCATHANNLTTVQDMTALSASLIFFFAGGAIISPILAAELIDQFGPNAMFSYFAGLHGLLLLYTLYRARIRPNVPTTKAYMYIPRTTLFIAKTIRTLRSRKH